MDTKKFITGTLAGGVAYFFLGFLFYAVYLKAFSSLPDRPLFIIQLGN